MGKVFRVVYLSSPLCLNIDYQCCDFTFTSLRFVYLQLGPQQVLKTDII